MAKRQTQFQIRVQLADRARQDDSKLSRYPDISDSERERLDWSVSGLFGMFEGKRAITIGVPSDSDYVDDYIGRLLLGLHSKLPKLYDGEEFEQQILDNPGRIRVIPLNSGIVRVKFDSGSGDCREATLSRSEFAFALISATEDLLEQLGDLNPNLDRSGIVSELTDANEASIELAEDLE